MDPLTIITTAVAAGAAASAKDVATQAVKDGYAAFKALLLRKFGSKEDVVSAVQGVEKKPESQGRQETLKEELEASGADQDAELVEQAQALFELLKKQGLVSGPSYQATVTGGGAIAQGPGAVAAGAGGVAIGGSVHGGAIVTGDHNRVTTSPTGDEEQD